MSERTPIFEKVGGLERGEGDNRCEKLLDIIGRRVLKCETMMRRRWTNNSESAADTKPPCWSMSELSVSIS